MTCSLCNEIHLAYGMFLRTHVRTRRCIANSPDIRSHHYCCGGYHLGCMPWYCDPWTFADTAGLVPWIGHHGLLIGGRLETRYRGVPVVLHRTFDWRLVAMLRWWVSLNWTSWLLPFGYNGSIVRYPNNCHEIDCHGLLFGVSGILFVAMEWFHHGLLIVVRR